MWMHCLSEYKYIKWKQKIKSWGFPGDSVVKNLPANAEDMGSIPDPGRSHMPGINWTHAPQLLSLSSRAFELQLMKATYPRARALQ